VTAEPAEPAQDGAFQGAQLAEGLPRLAGAQRYEPDVDLATLRDHPKNPRRGDDNAVGLSLDVNGWYGVIIAQESTRRILAGHTRRRTLTAAGATRAPVLWLDVDDTRAEDILLVDNRSAELATWDMAALTELLTGRGPADLVGTGFTSDDLAILSAGAFISRQRDEDDAGDHPEDDRGLWPLLAFRVPPLLLQRFRALPGEDDTDRLAALVGLPGVPQIGGQNENPGGGDQP
jgi:hypothetical protein